MADFKLGDMVLCREIHCVKSPWIALTYVGIGEDGEVYFSNGRHAHPDSIEMVLLTEENVRHLGSCNDVPPRYEPECGELVAVKDEDDPYWRPVVYIKKGEKGEFVCGAYNNMEYNKRFVSSWELCEPIHKHFNVPKCSEDA